MSTRSLRRGAARLFLNAAFPDVARKHTPVTLRHSMSVCQPASTRAGTAAGSTARGGGVTCPKTDREGYRSGGGPHSSRFQSPTLLRSLGRSTGVSAENGRQSTSRRPRVRTAHIDTGGGPRETHPVHAIYRRSSSSVGAGPAIAAPARSRTMVDSSRPDHPLRHRDARAPESRSPHGSPRRQHGACTIDVPSIHAPPRNRSLAAPPTTLVKKRPW